MWAATRKQPGSDFNEISETATKPAGAPRRSSRHVSRGQIIILFAGALIGLIGLLGLATDLGYAFVQRRTMQNAADAGAIAGAHTLSNSDPAAPLIVLGDVQQTAWANRTGSTHPTITHCQYVDDSDNELGDCSKPVPPTSAGIVTGVSVTVKETHDTFFMGIIPGGPQTLSTSASAIAHVQQLKSPPGDGPFVVCGVSPKIDAGTRNVDIVTPTAAGWQLNPNAVTTATHVGPTFQVFGPNVSTCGLGSQNFKGQAVGTNNASLTAPDWFSYANGDAAGHVNVSVNGVNGCTPALIINCVAFLPVVVNNPPPNTTTNKMWAVMILPFYLTAASTSNGNLNKLDAQILGDYITEGNGKPGWIPGNKGPIVIKLTK